MADWLDENGEAEHAEFIRVQVAIVEILKLGTHVPPNSECNVTGTCDRCNREGKVIELRKRLDELWKFTIATDDDGNQVFSPDSWFAYDRDFGWTFSYGMNKAFLAFDLDGEKDVKIELQRGFPSVVACTLNQWLEYGKEIVRRFPITGVNVTDKEPLKEDLSIGICYTWWIMTNAIENSGTPWIRNLINPPIYDALEWRNCWPGGNEGGFYNSKEAAMIDLSQACVRWANATD